MQKLTKRKQQALETRKKILDTSIDLVNEYGYDNVSVDRICGACNISKGAFYHHFRSKIDILSESEAHINEVLKQTLAECHDMRIEQRLLIFSNSLIDVAEKTGFEFTRQRSKYVISGEYIDDYTQTSYAIYSRKLISDLINESVINGELLKNTPVDLLTDTLMIFLSGLITDWCTFNGSYSISEKSWKLTPLLIRGLILPYKNSEYKER
ncbi:TetR/AcrR family transcriptional regulator [Dehalobacter sp. DCM]|uniref:TetR/AcrR family transcriptional regulator n=1 Tax=Dehalobacter sp. DCM TaxID=2907827 RepID=UPI003081D71D|nr:TetR/AcrR family transcriptional regulator [Dehalobacter sp. DCM]